MRTIAAWQVGVEKAFGHQPTQAVCFPAHPDPQPGRMERPGAGKVHGHRRVGHGHGPEVVADFLNGARRLLSVERQRYVPIRAWRPPKGLPGAGSNVLERDVEMISNGLRGSDTGEKTDRSHTY